MLLDQRFDAGMLHILRAACRTGHRDRKVHHRCGPGRHRRHRDPARHDPGQRRHRLRRPAVHCLFTAGGSQSSPLAQAQAQAQGQGQENGCGDGFGGFGGFNGFGAPATAPACYTSNTDLTVPSAVALVSAGALVDGTVCGSPAASAGLTGGSVITAVNGTPVTSPDDLTGILARFRPGTTISVTWTSRRASRPPAACT
jgi:PDZ domain-containing protein